jgi:3-oxoacyl-[acyl-carrier-protein] synthase-1
VSRPALAVTGIEAVTPVGLDATETGAALRARLSGVVEHPFLLLAGRDPAWDPPEPLRMGLVPALDPGLTLEARLVTLARRAIQGLVARTRLTRAELSRTGLVLVLPEPDPSTAALGATLPPQILTAARLDAVVRHEVHQDGHPGLCHALARADAAFRAGWATAALLVLVDSFADQRRVRHHQDSHRLRARTNADGFLPGEAGVALLVEPLAGGRASSGRAILARLSLPSFGAEPSTLTGDLTSTGTGLAEAVLAQVGRGAPVSWVVSDLNGEHYGAHEWSVVAARLTDALGALRAFHHPLESTGDVGAATGGLLAAHVLHAFARGASPAAEALLVCGSAGSTRAALTLYAP